MSDSPAYLCLPQAQFHHVVRMERSPGVYTAPAVYLTSLTPSYTETPPRAKRRQQRSWGTGEEATQAVR